MEIILFCVVKALYHSHRHHTTQIDSIDPPRQMNSQSLISVYLSVCVRVANPSEMQ